MESPISFADVPIKSWRNRIICDLWQGSPELRVPEACHYRTYIAIDKLAHLDKSALVKLVAEIAV